MLEGESLTRSGIMTSREWAAQVLSEVADNARFGGYPSHVNSFDLGRALSRACINNNQQTMEDFFDSLRQGWLHTEEQRHRIS